MRVNGKRKNCEGLRVAQDFGGSYLLPEGWLPDTFWQDTGCDEVFASPAIPEIVWF
jgi:hypothetical protein